MNKRIVSYQTVDGRSPFEEWLNSLRDFEGAARIRMRLDRVRFGNLGLTRFVGRGVFEMKFPFGPGYRIYFGQDGLDTVVLLCGGHKSTQSKDILKAYDYWKEYRRKR